MAEVTGGPLSEVSSAAATGRTARLYADIRSVTGAPMVNLVYRHLATDVDRLGRVWDALRPAFVDGRVGRAAEALPAPLAPLPAEQVRTVFDRWDVPTAAHEGLSSTLRAYGRANRSNLVAFSALMDRAPGHLPSADAPAGGDWPLPDWPPGLPTMAPLDTTSGEVTRLLYQLGRARPGSPDAFIPSLYRHLTAWPALLEALLELVAPSYERGQVASSADTLRVAADVAATVVDQDGTIAGALPDEVAPVIDTFCGRISEMLVIGRLLESVATAPPAAPQPGPGAATDGPRAHGEDHR